MGSSKEKITLKLIKLDNLIVIAIDLKYTSQTYINVGIIIITIIY